MPFDVGHSTLPSAVNCRSQYASLCTCRSCPILDLSSFICRFIRCQLFVAGSQIQLQLSWSLLSCYCGHCCSCGCSSWLLLRLLFVAAPAAALCGCSRCGSPATSVATLLAALVGAISGYFCGRSFRLPLLCSFLLLPRALFRLLLLVLLLACFEDTLMMAAAWAAGFM